MAKGTEVDTFRLESLATLFCSHLPVRVAHIFLRVFFVVFLNILFQL